jgi:hypothetical protein
VCLIERDLETSTMRWPRPIAVVPPGGGGCVFVGGVGESERE